MKLPNPQTWTEDEWREDVRQGNTRLGYEEWVLHNMEWAAGECDVCEYEDNRRINP